MTGIEMRSASKVHGNASSNSTVFSSNSKVKISQYSKVLGKKTKGCRLDILKVLGCILDICRKNNQASFFHSTHAGLI